MLIYFYSSSNANVVFLLLKFIFVYLCYFSWVKCLSTFSNTADMKQNQFYFSTDSCLQFVCCTKTTIRIKNFLFHLMIWHVLGWASCRHFQQQENRWADLLRELIYVGFCWPQQPVRGGFKQLSNPLSWTKWEKSGMARRSELVDVWVTGPWLFILTTHSSPHGRLSAEVSMADCPLQNTSATKHRRNQTKLAEKLIVSWQLDESVTHPSWFTTAAPLLWNHVDRQHLLQQIPCH